MVPFIAIGKSFEVREKNESFDTILKPYFTIKNCEKFKSVELIIFLQETCFP